MLHLQPNNAIFHVRARNTSRDPLTGAQEGLHYACYGDGVLKGARKRARVLYPSPLPAREGKMWRPWWQAPPMRR